MAQSILQYIVLLLAVAVVTVAIFRRFNLPPILAYLLVGVLVGPHGWGWVLDSQDTRFMAEFGVVFLLFSIGLEFSRPQLLAMKGEVLGLGGGQVVLTTAVGALVAWLFGVSPGGALAIGGILAMSSTAIVIKQLTEQLELHSRHGRLSVGILLFQDLAVIPFLILIPALGGGAETSVALGLFSALVKGGLVVLVMLGMGRWVLRPVFQEIASFRSPELFTLAVLLFSLAAAWLTHLSGLSLALGAFLAGMMLGETAFRSQVEADIRPFRDVLLGLFFITVGMLLDVQLLPHIVHWVAALVIAIVLVKLLLIVVISLFAGVELGVALRTGSVLSQGGEFGFVLLSLALSGGLVSEEVAQIVLAAVVMSMALAPLFIRYNGWLAKHVAAASYGHSRERAKKRIAESARTLDQHVIICGYGRIGQNIAQFVEKAGLDYIALDLDPIRVRNAQAAGQRVSYGDATHLEIQQSAGLNRARALVVSFDDPQATLKILEQVRGAQPDIPILVRTRDDTNLERFEQAGATETIPETLEGSLMLSSHLLFLLGVPASRINSYVQEVRSDRYRILRQFFRGQEPSDLSAPVQSREGLHTVILPSGAFAVGRLLGELHLENCQVTVNVIRRGEGEAIMPALDTVLQEGDAVVLYGTREALERAEGLLLSG